MCFYECVCVCVHMLHKADKRRVKDTQIELSNGSESLYVSESDCSSQASEVYKWLPTDLNLEDKESADAGCNHKLWACNVHSGFLPRAS